ncbi:MAG: FHA domain-containing protein [Myxococcales bacterium]|nr:MAG: FHA domain-containing protein [Myxococcales bacterium]
MHAVIETNSDGEVHIVDLGSAAGTVVNGKKVNKARLDEGDEIRLGNTRIVVHFAHAGDDVIDADEATIVSDGGTSGIPPLAFADDDRTAVGQSPANSPIARPSGRPAVPSARPRIPTPQAAFMAPSLGSDLEEEDPEKVRYGLLASGPPVDPHDVETSDPAVEVVVMWGDNSVLHVAHLSPPRAFYVGEGSLKPKKGELGVDFVIGREAIGVDRLPVVVDAGGGVAVVIPDGATGENFCRR